MKKTIDLTNCDTEPIHIPGRVQSHGFLIAIDHQLTIRFYSENLHTFLPHAPKNLLGEHINLVEPIIGENEPPDFIAQLISFGKANKSFDQTNPFSTDIQGQAYYLIISPAESYYLLEFEPATSDLKTDVQKAIGRSISEILADKDLNTLLQNTAAQVKNVIEYDRVMIYKFAEDGHGEVVAEAKNDDLPTWMGLHYPASDIPKQARELYKKNYTRIIANVYTETSPIVAAKETDVLDLTNSQLRAVSPMHIQYLQNMKVDSSFSISLLYKKELWGLIACHNYTPRFIDFKARDSSKLIGQILSSALEFRQDEANQILQDRFKTNVDTLSKTMLKSNGIEEALLAKDVNILGSTNATGAVLTYEGHTHKLGKTPDDEQLEKLVKWLKRNVNESFYYTNEFPSIYPDAEAFKHVGSGIMVLTLSQELSEYIIWFKPEHIQNITWAGDPEKQVEIDERGMPKISPRHSFEAWTQQVSGKSEIWNTEEVKSAVRLKSEVVYAINQKAGAIRVLNERLKQAYEELDTFSFTISHDLKNPLSTIKGYAQMLTRVPNVDPKVQETLGKIANRVDKMNAMINEVLNYSRIGRSDITRLPVDMEEIINEQIKDLKIAYNADHLKVKLGKLPILYGDKGMLSQVFANLLSNAIKYSLPSGKPEISVEGVDTEDEVTYTIKDNGVGIDIKHLPNIFELFKRMDNVEDIEGSGVGLAIVKRIVEKHNGRIWVDSDLGQGSTFSVSISKN